MNIGIVCCGRLENRYAIEFVNHYKNLGFDQIFIVDNNRDNEEHFEDVLQSYIDDKFVTIYNYRDRERVQRFAYIEIYNKISNELDYDWLLFIDFDEYLILNEDNNIKDYLSRECFKDYNQILINWKVYSDNNLIYDDGRPCLERFTEESKDCAKKYGTDENELTKPFLRTGIKNVGQENWHYFFDEQHILDNTSCNNAGQKCINDAFIETNYKLAYFKHFITKTIDEYVTNKCIRGCGDMTIWEFNERYGIKRFFMYNEVTPEKIQYLKDHNIDYTKYINL